ncbi:K(+) efflux antiporter 2, chloroplastic, partial [Stylosanthes scabra]|nr:K(+) efflux antiporter 2, chloroplastic [Stylosanthes scabra]
MDIGCSLPHSKMVLDRFDSCIAFGGRGFYCTFRGNSRAILMKARFSAMKKNGSSSSRLACVGEFNFSNVKKIGKFCGNSDDFQVGSDLDSISGAASNEPLEDEKTFGGEIEQEVQTVDELKELLHKALKELQVARHNSAMFEERVKKISESAIFFQDEASRAWNDVNSTLDIIQEIVGEEFIAKEAVQKATMALSFAEARLQVAMESLEVAKGAYNPPSQGAKESNDDEDILEEEQLLVVAQEDIKECQSNLANCESELRYLQSRKEELQNEVNKLHEIAEKAQTNAVKAEEDVANIMLLAEQAVADELKAAQAVNDAEIALSKADTSASSVNADSGITLQEQEVSAVPKEENIVQSVSGDDNVDSDRDSRIDDEALLGKQSSDRLSDKTSQIFEDTVQSDYLSDHENGQLSLDPSKEAEVEVEKIMNAVQMKKQETQKDMTRDNPPPVPKALLNKSSRFFPASFFSFTVDGDDNTPESFLQSFVESAQKLLPKLVIGILLLGGGISFYASRSERSSQLLQKPELITTTAEEVSTSAKPLVRHLQNLPTRIKNIIASLSDHEVDEEEASLFDMLWLLLASVIFVPMFQKIPGAIAEFGVVFLLFNIGLELSFERLSSMKKYVFGLGTAQVLVTAVVVGLVAHYVCGQAGPAAIVIGNGLALSSTAVVLQVLQERGESTSRHGRATFSVLLFQDLAVVVLLILIPLISPNSSKGGVGFQAIAEALGLAAVKAAVAITVIIAGGRLLLRPIYRQIAENQNAEIFSANTLFVILGTSLLTARAGLSMALGSFLAGLLLAETEFSLQVESDIAPYRGLLLGLFFMTVGMSIDPKLLVSKFQVIMGTLALFLCGKTLLITVIARIFGISLINAIRVSLLLAPGGEFAFVAFGEAVNQGIMSSQMSSLLFLLVGISM